MITVVRWVCLVLLLAGVVAVAVGEEPRREDLLVIDSGNVRVGIDRKAGGSITWLSGGGYGKNMVNSHDPGRLIQQSYYAGRSLDRKAEGQHAAWSPWTWNPIQGGGVGSWARVTKSEVRDGLELFAETVPKLWDMPDEEAAAMMRQWTGFEPGMPNVVVVRCELVAKRAVGDPWGPAALRPQEVPACYFTRNFRVFQSYLGKGKWRIEEQPMGPPWGKAEPPRRAMGCFDSEGQGVAVFSPGGVEPWNFGPHGGWNRAEAKDGPCVHVAPIAKVELGPRSTVRYRYWLTLGSEEEIATRLDALWEKYGDERVELSDR